MNNLKIHIEASNKDMNDNTKATYDEDEDSILTPNRAKRLNWEWKEESHSKHKSDNKENFDFSGYRPKTPSKEDKHQGS